MKSIRQRTGRRKAQRMARDFLFCRWKVRDGQVLDLLLMEYSGLDDFDLFRTWMQRNSTQVKNLRPEEKLHDGFGEGERTHWEESYGIQGKAEPRGTGVMHGCIEEGRVAGAANGDRNGEQASGAYDEFFWNHRRESHRTLPDYA